MPGALSVVKPGVLLGEDVTKVFRLAKDEGWAIPAVNCTSSSTVNAVLEAAQKVKSPVICQFSNGGAAFYAGKAIPNKNQEASILGVCVCRSVSVCVCWVCAWACVCACVGFAGTPMVVCCAAEFSCLSLAPVTHLQSPLVAVVG